MQFMNNDNNQTMNDILKSLGPATTSVLNSAGATPQDALGDSHQAIMQGLMAKVAEKKIVDNLNQHADNLMATDPNALAILTTAIAMHQANQGDNSKQDGNVSASSDRQSSSSTGQASIPSPQPAAGIFSGASISPDGTMNQEGVGNKILRSLLGVGGQSNVDALYNTSQLQKITGQEPLQKSQYQQADLDVTKAVKLAQQVPLTQEQQGQLTAGSNTAKLQIYNDAAQRINSQIDVLNKQFEAEQKTISPIQATLMQIHGEAFLTPRQKQIQGQLFKLNNALGTLNKQGALLKLQNPASNVPIHTASQMDTYNKARTSGLTIEQAKRKAGI